FSLGRDTLIISGTNSMLRADRNAFSLRLAPDGKPIAQNGISGMIANTRLTAVQIGMPQIRPTPDMPAELSFFVMNDNALAVALQLTELPDAVKAMKACHDDLLSGWGFDLVQMAKVKTPAAEIDAKDKWGDPLTYSSKGSGKNWGFRLDIDAAGTVTKCQPILSSGSAETDAKYCETARTRRRFSPATDAAGVPVASQIMQNTFVIVRP
ncbi:MAG: hypothetical protein RLZZ58_1142, partial [Pseudomonadota bacterium]